MSRDSLTGATLLRELHRDPDNQTAWKEFVQRYGIKIYRWCRHWQLSEADAEDVTQNVLLQLSGKMRTFVYDPSRSFRAWLKTLTHHAWADFVTSRARQTAGSGDTHVLALLHTVEARDDLIRGLDEEFDQELLQLAMQRVQSRVQPRTWEAFRLLALEGLSGAETARRLDMKVATVFVNRSNVQKMLQDEVRRLEESA